MFQFSNIIIVLIAFFLVMSFSTGVYSSNKKTGWKYAYVIACRMALVGLIGYVCYFIYDMNNAQNEAWLMQTKFIECARTEMNNGKYESPIALIEKKCIAQIEKDN